MPTKWTRVRAAFDLLSERNGAKVSTAEIAEAASWAQSTARTYVRKLWTGILSPTSDGAYSVSLPNDFTWEQFQALHTQVVLPPKTPTPTKYEFDVALSFAGEDRPYAAQVADVLKAYDIQVFYDTYEKNTLWGKDLYAHLDEVYRVRSRYCVIFISKHYKSKLWTNHERKAAQARAFQEQGEYILPVRLDGTEIPGIQATIGYLDGMSHTPAEIANEIAEKLEKATELAELLARLEAFLGGYGISQDGPNLVFYNEVEDHTVVLSIRMLIEAMRMDQLDYFLMSSIFIQ